MEKNKNHKIESELPSKTTLEGYSKKETDPNNLIANNKKTYDETNDKSSDKSTKKKPLVTDEKVLPSPGNQE